MGIEREKRLGLYGLTGEARAKKMAEIREEVRQYRAGEEERDREHAAKVARLKAQGVKPVKFGWRPDNKDETQPWMTGAKGN